jgi:MOSC domain-containing protein YiiM
VKLISVCVGRPRQLTWQGRSIRTSIWKSPVEGRVRVATLNIEGDEQADPAVHGGSDKAVYLYPLEHYAYWHDQLPGVELPCGAFGENFTTEGLLEEQACIGDHLRIGSAEFVVTQPRMPCFKLGVRFDRPDIVKRFLHARRTGFYLSVVREGYVAAGDSIEFATRDEHGVTVADIVNLYGAGSDTEGLLRRVLGLTALPQSLKNHFRERLSDP